ncbi:MAG: PLP-dependent aminotransferase family protein [Parasporobacterium sp.]|nr:PLP-dependent aminotransferase family protein [Parasporobacterium sp.]
MNYSIDKSRRIPAYMQLYEQIRRDIVSGIFPYGTRLPSKRIIAEETGISIITAEHTLNILNEEGYVETRPRSGVYVIYRKADFPADLRNEVLQEEKSDRTNGKASGEPGRPDEDTPREPGRADEQAPGRQEQLRFPFTVLARTMRKVLADLGEEIFLKSPGTGCETLRQEICAYLGRSRGIRVQPSRIVVGSGAEYLYGLIAQLFRDNPVFALEDPSYPMIRSVYESFGIRCDMLKMTDNGISSRELLRTQARILHVTPFHSFPSHVTADVSKKNEYLEWAVRREGVIIEDNYDSELTVSKKQEDPLFSMSKGKRVIYLNTFSQTIAPSMRAGYLVLPEELTETFYQRLGFYSCTVPVFEQYVLAELLRNGDYERHINRVRRARRKQLQEKQ